MKKTSRQMSETYIIGIFLALAGGFLDAYTYLMRGNVFANAQTGNIVLLGVTLAKGELSKAIYYIFPILAFAIGVLFCEIIRHILKFNKVIHWRQLIILLEIIILAVTAFVPRGRLDIAVNTLVSFVCALQVESFRIISGNTVATTMCTGNLRSGTELLFSALLLKDKYMFKKSMQYYGIIFFFIIGAFAQGIASKFIGAESVLVACAILVVPFILMFKEKNK